MISTKIQTIPAEDLARQYQQIRWEIAAAIDSVLPSGKYTLGPVLEKFEAEFAAYCGVSTASASATAPNRSTWPWQLWVWERGMR